MSGSFATDPKSFGDGRAGVAGAGAATTDGAAAGVTGADATGPGGDGAVAWLTDGRLAHAVAKSVMTTAVPKKT